MSRILKQLELVTPSFMSKGRNREMLVSPGHKCGYCQGNGWFWGEEHHESVKVNCPVCGGSGQLDAIVTVDWKPTRKEE